MLNVVTGPPCAGKSTYVEEHRNPGSVVVDFDKLAVALGAESDHRCDGDVYRAAQVARSAVIRACREFQEAWVIHTSLDAHSRKAFAGAVFHDLDPGMDECIRRARADGRPNGTESEIAAWYSGGQTGPSSQPKENVRVKNGGARRRLRLRLKARRDPCWICQAFGRPSEIDYSLPARHPMSFEVDELVPVSRGGSPTDIDNVAATHRICNEWRGNKSVEEVLALASKGASPAPEEQGGDDVTSIEW